MSRFSNRASELLAYREHAQLGAVAIDDIRTGTWLNRVDDKPTSLHVRRCRLRVIAGPDSGTAVELGSSWFRVGARNGCDLTLTDRRVSGHHFQIRVDEHGYRLQDLHSKNGTYVAGHRVSDVYLNPGSVIYVGDSRLRFEPLSAAVDIPLSESDRFGRMVGRSVPMRAIFAHLERIAPTDANILITGETGTGKELVAEAVHEHSPRRHRPFEILDCGSVAENLIASELFGHERGAFTGAFSGYQGVFERANGGTVFLDEIGELPLDLQPKLLGVLERRMVKRLGATRAIPVDIRVLAATNRDLAIEMNHGRFRDDLYYRLAVCKVHMPALRDRREDIDLLIDCFLADLPGGHAVRLQEQTLANLHRHDYPGNVRELRNLIERAVILAGALPNELTPGRVVSRSTANKSDNDESKRGSALQVCIDPAVPFKLAKKHLLEQFERLFLEQLLELHDGNVSKAARATGLDRMTVHKMMGRSGLGKKRSR